MQSTGGRVKDVMVILSCPLPVWQLHEQGKRQPSGQENIKLCMVDFYCTQSAYYVVFIEGRRQTVLTDGAQLDGTDEGGVTIWARTIQRRYP
jgi:hypothetical protein